MQGRQRGRRKRQKNKWVEEWETYDRTMEKQKKPREEKKQQLIIQARRCTIYQTAFIYYYANGQNAEHL